MNLVLDANVLIKAYVPEILSEKTNDLFKKAADKELALIVPDLIFPEIGNVLWKKNRLKELSASEVKEICQAIILLPLKIEPSKALVQLAIDISMVYDISVYDAIYIALAMVYETRLVTADKKIVDSMAGTPLMNHVQWLGDS
jgi:predicted nucleic acid-binding protein